MNIRFSKVSAFGFAAMISLSFMVPANAQLIAPNWPTPVSPYELQALNLQHRVHEAYHAGLISDLEFAMYDQEVFCAMDSMLWRRLRSVPDAVNSRHTMKKLKLIEDQFAISTEGRRK